MDSGDPAHGYGRRAVNGAVVTGLGTLVRGVCQVVAIVVLARLLLPADFGVMGMVFPLIAFATAIQDSGLGWAVLQRDKVSDEELSTMFWLNAAVGLSLGLLLLGLAPLAAYFYDEPRVAALTAASGSLILLGALSSQHSSLLQRRLQFGRLGLIDAISIVFGTLVAIAAAFIYHSYWAIFLLSFATAVARLALAWALNPWRPGKRAPLRQVVDMIRFGGDMMLGNVGGYFARNLDGVLIGRVWGAVALGYYERAYKVVLMPILFVHNPLFQLTVPILSRTRDDAARYRRIFLTGYQASLLVTVPGMVLLAAAAPVMVELVMGRNWLPGAPIFSWLAIACIAQLATGPLTTVFVSQGRSREAMIANIVTSVYSCAAFAIGVQWGALGVAKAFAISEIVRTPFMLWYATRSGPVRFKDAALAITPFLVVGAASLAIVAALTRHFDGLDQPLLFALLAASGAYLAAVPCMLVNQSGRTALQELLRLSFHLLPRTRAPA